VILYKYYLIGLSLIIASCSFQDTEPQKPKVKISSVSSSFDELQLPKFPDYPTPKTKLDEAFPAISITP